MTNQETILLLEVAEKSHPDNPAWNGKYQQGTYEYNEMLAAYDKLMERIEIGYFGVRRQEYKAAREKYYAYLKSPEWQEKRLVCLEYYDHRCAVCNSDQKIEVHHRTYERLYKERPNDLTALCDICHERYHDRMIDWFLFHTNIEY